MRFLKLVAVLPAWLLTQAAFGGSASTDALTSHQPFATTTPVDKAHRRLAIAAQAERVDDLAFANNAALRKGNIPEIERVDAELTRARKDLKELILQDQQMTAAEIAASGPTTGPAQESGSIVFVCDATGSMINKIAAAKVQLVRAVGALDLGQSFDIVFYQDETVIKLDGRLIAASPANARRAQDWIKDIVTAGTTDPVPASAFALKLKPEQLVFITDAADFPDVLAVQNTFRTLNADHKTRVNTILLAESNEEQDANKESEPIMQGISKENGGEFKWRRTDLER